MKRFSKKFIRSAGATAVFSLAVVTQALTVNGPHEAWENALMCEASPQGFIGNVDRVTPSRPFWLTDEAPAAGVFQDGGRQQSTSGARSMSTAQTLPSGQGPMTESTAVMDGNVMRAADFDTAPCPWRVDGEIPCGRGDIANSPGVAFVDLLPSSSSGLHGAEQTAHFDTGFSGSPSPMSREAEASFVQVASIAPHQGFDTRSHLGEFDPTNTLVVWSLQDADLGADMATALPMGSSVSPVPEPETYVLMLMGLASVFFMRRRAQKPA